MLSQYYCDQREGFACSKLIALLQKYFPYTTVLCKYCMWMKYICHTLGQKSLFFESNNKASTDLTWWQFLRSQDWKRCIIMLGNKVQAQVRTFNISNSTGSAVPILPHQLLCSGRPGFNLLPSCEDTSANTEYCLQTSLEERDYLDTTISFGSLWNYS